jgi:GNAT superfamily N-acetyltransferase
MEPLELILLEKRTGKPLAEALVADMEAFSATWHQPAIGISGVQVQPDWRRQGIGKFFMMQILRFLQEQCFELADLQIPADNEAGMMLCQQLGFEQVDTGKVYKKQSLVSGH